MFEIRAQAAERSRPATVRRPSVTRAAPDIDELVGDRAGAFQQRAILPQMREVEVGQPRLPRSE
jgi:hypothetical protein